MSNRVEIKSNRILAVEGKDECNFFKALLNYENIKNVQIIDIGGKDKFKKELPILINLEGFFDVHTLGFIRDAEQNQATSAFKSICSILQNNNLPAPQQSNTVFTHQNLAIGIFIMPNNVDEGMLEDLCLESIKDKAVFECVNQYIECCSQDDETIKSNNSKAKVQTYLASKKPIVNSLGVAATKGYWNFENNCFADIKLFLHSLFNQSVE